MTPLQLLDQRIREIVPSLQELSFGCEVLYGKEDGKEASLAQNCLYAGELSDGNVVLQLMNIKKVMRVSRDQFDTFAKVIGHPIQLHHVLQAIGQNWRLSVDSYVYRNEFCIYHIDKGEYFKWDLTKDLSNQSKECIEFLLSILK